MGTFKWRKYRDIVYAMYTQDRKTFKVSTGIKVPDRYWLYDRLSKAVGNYDAKVSILKSTL